MPDLKFLKICVLECGTGGAEGNGILFRKKIENHGNQEKGKGTRTPHSSRFLSRKHEKHFKVQGGGAEVAEASVREMEEDEADDDDAFEDDEDEEEEEDTEDSSD
ncbi:hypothetical protein LR48_Vigan04g093400 [Vigna angularis]|uniref:Uncharacterized protein n=1 Tax=Phaseolus angularis TaxID=3914 RepID=A0A0L9UDE2_PHAAN|nr:hypothetical protein LR48_Vigan04g093400 [Vigna angularis]